MHRSIIQFRLITIAISTMILTLSCICVHSKSPEQLNPGPAQIKVYKLVWKDNPHWEQVVFLATNDKDIVAQSEARLFLLSVVEGTESAHLRSVKNVSDSFTQFKTDIAIPIGLRAHMVALQMFGVMNQVKTAWYYEEKSCEGLLYSANSAEPINDKWQIQVEKSVQPIADLAYTVSFRDVNTPIFRYWNGMSAELFTGGRYSIGYSLPFRFDRECNVGTLWSELYPEDKPTQGPASADFLLFCDGHKFLIPTKERRFYGPFSGLDGSVSLIVEEADEWLWYHIR